jgi:hypothetical protein
MNGFFITKRKLFELVVLLCLDGLFYLLWNSLDFVVLFSLGFIWNWVASQEKDILILNSRQYRFSTLKTVFNLQHLILKPFVRMPEAVRLIVRVLPAGIFWFAVILFNESQMPWWAVFFGSLSIELLQLETRLFKSKETPQ